MQRGELGLKLEMERASDGGRAKSPEERSISLEMINHAWQNGEREESLMSNRLWFLFWPQMEGGEMRSVKAGSMQVSLEALDIKWRPMDLARDEWTLCSALAKERVS
ncbi:hypothetical protein AAC387_Pa12g0613 [Persea americana]